MLHSVAIFLKNSPVKNERSRRSVNLGTIAESLGFSISTVSRALRNDGGIKEETKSRIFDEAKSQGYLVGRRLDAGRPGKPQNILALGQSSIASFDLRYMAGMSAAAIDLNLAILSHHLDGDDLQSILNPARQPVVMRDGQLDGIVLLHRWPEPIAAKLSEQFPVVSIVHSYNNPRIDVVGTDDRQGIQKMVSHLQNCGHSKMAFFGLSPQVSWSRSRFGAYAEAMVTLGYLEAINNFVTIGLEEALSAQPRNEFIWADQVERLRRGGVTGWICASEVTALALHQYFASKGIRVPDEVALTGFHGQKQGNGQAPRITTADIPDEELGAAALRRLVHRINHPQESHRTILLPLALSPGQTTPANAAQFG